MRSSGLVTDNHSSTSIASLWWTVRRVGLLRCHRCHRDLKQLTLSSLQSHPNTTGAPSLSSSIRRSRRSTPSHPPKPPSAAPLQKKQSSVSLFANAFSICSGQQTSTLRHPRQPKRGRTQNTRRVRRARAMQKEVQVRTGRRRRRKARGARTFRPLLPRIRHRPVSPTAEEADASHRRLLLRTSMSFSTTGLAQGVCHIMMFGRMKDAAMGRVYAIRE